MSEELTREDDGPVVTPDYGRLSLDDLGSVLRLAAEGLSQRKIAEVVGCSQPTVSYALKRMGDSSSHLRSLMKSRAGKALQAWDDATDVAAKRGDHRPAKELLEAAYPELRPQHGDGGNGGITINIGTPGNPIALPVINISTVESTA